MTRAATASAFAATLIPFKKGERVTFRTVGRHGTTEPRKGKIADFYDTARGVFVAVKTSTGDIFKARLSNVQAA